MSFGEQLQLLRRRHNLTQEDFAQQLKVSRQAVSKWESSKGYPEVDKLLYICRTYGVTMDELFAQEVPGRRLAEADPDRVPDGAQPLESPPLKKAFGDFFTNLSPYNQTLFGAGAALITVVLLVLLCITVMKGASDDVMMKLIWLGLLIVFVIGEGLTVGLTSIWFAAGSMAALVCTLLGMGLWGQITVFILVSALSMLAFRPIAKRYINGKVEPTNADRIIGRQALVSEAIENLSGKGAVSIGGLIWSARSEHDELIPVGTLVRILRIEGVKVYVEQVKEDV